MLEARHKMTEEREHGGVLCSQDLGSFVSSRIIPWYGYMIFASFISLPELAFL